jgi:hypothetical protein
MRTPNATTAPFYDVDWVNGRYRGVLFTTANSCRVASRGWLEMRVA